MERGAVWRCRSPRRKDTLVSDFAVCARNSGRYTKRRSVWSKRAFRRCRSAGAWGPPVSAAPKRFGSLRRRGHLLRGSARRNRPCCWKNQRCSRFVHAIRALGSSSARLRNAAHCQGLPRAEARLVPKSRLVAGNASSPVIAERRRSIRRSSRRSLEPDPSTRDKPKCQSELPRCKQQGWRKGRGFFRLLAWSRPKPRPPASSPKTRRWVRARGKGPNAIT